MGFITVGKGNSTRNQYVLLGTLNADQEALAASMQAAWANFAASGDPSTATVPWPSFGDGGTGMLLVTPQPQIDSEFAVRHHCAFWAAG